MNKLLASNGQNPMLQNEYLREYLFIFGTAMPELLKKKMLEAGAESSSPDSPALTHSPPPRSNPSSPNPASPGLSEDSSSVATFVDSEPVFEVPLLILDTKKVKLHLRDSNFDTTAGQGLNSSNGIIDTKEGCVLTYCSC